MSPYAAFLQFAYEGMKIQTFLYRKMLEFDQSSPRRTCSVNTLALSMFKSSHHPMNTPDIADRIGWEKTIRRKFT